MCLALKLGGMPIQDSLLDLILDWIDTEFDADEERR